MSSCLNGFISWLEMFFFWVSQLKNIHHIHLGGLSFVLGPLAFRLKAEVYLHQDSSEDLRTKVWTGLPVDGQNLMKQLVMKS